MIYKKLTLMYIDFLYFIDNQNFLFGFGGVYVK